MRFDRTVFVAAILCLMAVLVRPGWAQTEVTELTIGVAITPDTEIMQQTSDAFEAQYPNIRINWLVLPQAELQARLTADLATGSSSFDIMMVGINDVPVYAGNNWIRSLDELIASNPERVQPNYDMEDVFQSLRDNMSYEDQLYALPIYGESVMTYYNTAMFEAAGLEMPERPTWEQIRELACALHNPEQGQYGISLRGTPTAAGGIFGFFHQVVNTYGGRWFDENWMPQLDQPEWREALTLYSELLRECGAPSPQNNGFVENLNLMAQGQIAIWVDATVAAGFLRDPEQSTIVDDIGFAWAPVGPEPKGYHWLWAWGLVVPVTSEQPEAALQYITWVTSKDYVQIVADEFGWNRVPPGARASTYENPAYREAAPYADLVLESIASVDMADSTRDPVPYIGIGYIVMPEYFTFADPVAQLFSGVLAGEVSIDDALARAQEITLQVVTDAGYIQP